MIYYKIEIFILSVRTEILPPLSNLTLAFLHNFSYSSEIFQNITLFQKT
jgi:hypothetical protein